MEGSGAQLDDDDEVTHLLQDKNTQLKSKIGKLEQLLQTRQKELQRIQQVCKGTEEAIKATNIQPLENLQQLIHSQEDVLRDELSRDKDASARWMAFLDSQQKARDEEQKLKHLLQQKEEELRDIHEDICCIDTHNSNMTPEEQTKAKLYIEWKKLVQKKDDCVLRFRSDRYHMLMDLKVKRETMLVLAALEADIFLKDLQAENTRLQQKIAETEETKQHHTEGLARSRKVMQRFSKEFEQLRVAMRLNKAVQESKIVEAKQLHSKLQRAEERFQDLVDVEKQRVAAEEAAIWRERVEEAARVGDEKVQAERKLINSRIQKLKVDLRRKCEEKFKPLMTEAKSQLKMANGHAGQIGEEIRAKERMLFEATQEAQLLRKRIEEEKARLATEQRSMRAELGRMMDDLTGLWDSLHVPLHSRVGFLAQLEEAAPPSDAVFQLYEEELHSLGSGGSVSPATKA